MADETPLQTVSAPDAGDCQRQPRSWWDVYQGGWRPACGWIIACILARALIVPLVELWRGQPPEPIAWVELTALAVVLVGARSFDKAKGTA